MLTAATNRHQIVQILIERGCQYTVRNNEGFTASDYAYSYDLRPFSRSDGSDEFDQQI
jgi:hypothetical protein